jgi:hypothetical protein
LKKSAQKISMLERSLKKTPATELIPMEAQVLVELLGVGMVMVSSFKYFCG